MNAVSYVITVSTMIILLAKTHLFIFLDRGVFCDAVCTVAQFFLSVLNLEGPGVYVGAWCYGRVACVGVVVFAVTRHFFRSVVCCVDTLNF